MRALLWAVSLVAALAGRGAAAEELPSAVVTVTPPSAVVTVTPPSGDVDALERSGRQRIGAGIALIVVGVLGWGVSAAGTVLSIVGYVKDSRNECAMGACDTIKTTGTWLGVGGTVAEVGGLGGGIPLLISGVRRVREARRLRVGAMALPSGAALQVGGRF